MVERVPEAEYSDPLDVLWSQLLEDLGFQLRRSDDAYASFDGERTLTICTPQAFDADDCLAQMILHELCHALVGQEASRTKEDWGLASQGDANLDEEYAVHRLQATFAARYGLRQFMAVTTEWRPHYDAMGPDPLRGPGRPEELARRGLAQARAWNWEAKIDAVLKTTAQWGDALRPAAVPGSLWSRTRERHPAGFLMGKEGSCGTCAWSTVAKEGAFHCLQRMLTVSEDVATVMESWPGCDRFEPTLPEGACASCGACCREAFDVVPVEEDEKLHEVRADLIEMRAGLFVIARPEGQCRALNELPVGHYRCSVYELRPRACMELARGSAGCLEARQRLGISRG